MKPSNNWVKDMENSSNDAGIIRPHLYNAARHARIEKKREAVERFAQALHACSSFEEACARNELKKAIEELKREMR